MKEINIKVIPQDQQRYETAGDYVEKDGNLDIRITDYGNDDYFFLIAVHELIEAYLCKKKGIDFEKIDKFDMEFKGEGEPGDDINCPYKYQHEFATIIERLLASRLKIDWVEYNNEI